MGGGGGGRGGGGGKRGAKQSTITFFPQKEPKHTIKSLDKQAPTSKSDKVASKHIPVTVLQDRLMKCKGSVKSLQDTQPLAQCKQNTAMCCIAQHLGRFCVDTKQDAS